MPKFEVKYTTNERPTQLPSGAVVTQVSNLPLSMVTKYSSRAINIKKDSFDNTVFISVETGSNTAISPDEVRQIIDALTEAIEGLPDAAPKKLKDRQGDIWDLQADGTYTCTGNGTAYKNWKLSRVESEYGPVVEA